MLWSCHWWQTLFQSCLTKNFHSSLVKVMCFWIFRTVRYREIVNALMLSRPGAEQLSPWRALLYGQSTAWDSFYFVVGKLTPWLPRWYWSPSSALNPSWEAKHVEIQRRQSKKCLDGD
jgi:hypothetical protein